MGREGSRHRLTERYDRPMAHLHSDGFDHLCGVYQARRRPSSLQGVVEVEFSLRQARPALSHHVHMTASDREPEPHYSAKLT